MKWQYYSRFLLFQGISTIFLFIFIFGQGYGQQIITRDMPFFPTKEDSLEDMLTDSLKHSNPSKVLEKFIYAGTCWLDGESRREYSAFSDSGWVKEEALNPISPGNICDLNIGRYYIVRDFHILPLVKMSDSTEKGYVIYDQIAVHLDDTVRIAQKLIDTVTYWLVRKDRRWKVIDPPCIQRINLQIVRDWFDFDTHPRFRGGLLVGRAPHNMTFDQLKSLWRYNLSVLNLIK
jgi:hypothetical protein